MTNENFFNLDFDLDLENVVVEETEEVIKTSSLFTESDFTTWYMSDDVIKYFTDNGIAKYKVKGAVRAIYWDIAGMSTEKQLEKLMDVVLNAQETRIHTSKIIRDQSRAAAVYIGSFEVMMIANLIRNALLGIDV